MYKTIRFTKTYLLSCHHTNSYGERHYQYLRKPNACSLEQRRGIKKLLGINLDFTSLHQGYKKITLMAVTKSAGTRKLTIHKASLLEF